MSNGDNGRNSKAERTLRNRVARAIFSSAETMGISDRDMIEGLTEQVIERLDRVPTLPGMEHLAPEIRRPVPETEIRSIARSILAERGPETFLPVVEKEEQSMATPPIVKMKTSKRERSRADISPNARAVLERRYLVKDKQGQVVETAEDMFRRVAHHIAAADLIYDPKADVVVPGVGGEPEAVG